MSVRVEFSQQNGDSLVSRSADLALSKPPRWAWNGRIALGSLNLILGAEGVGKGTLAAWTIAKLTRGTLPGDLEGDPVAVGLLGDEDGFDAVWTPRLHAAGADLERVRLIEKPDGYVELAADREGLTKIIRENEIRVLWCDALLDNLGAIDDWRAKQVRDALGPLRMLAREEEIAPVGCLHPNKSGSSFRQLVAGSVAFNALSRSSLLLAQHPDDEDRRVIVRGKGNLSRTPAALEFSIATASFTANGYRFDVPRAVDFTESELTVDDLIGPAPAPTPRAAGEARTSARDRIADLLADGEWHSASEVTQTCEEHGVYDRAARRAANDLGVEQEKRGFPASSFWRLPQSGRTEGTHARTVHYVPSVRSGEGSNSLNSSYIGREDSLDSMDSEDVCPSSGPLCVSPPQNALTADIGDDENGQS